MGPSLKRHIYFVYATYSVLINLQRLVGLGKIYLLIFGFCFEVDKRVDLRDKLVAFSEPALQQLELLSQYIIMVHLKLNPSKSCLSLGNTLLNLDQVSVISKNT